jgi:micrococcal nuclease
MKTRLLLSLFWCLSMGVCLCASFTGQVVGISDGDTITVLEGREQTKVRLVGIDTPESKQAFGSKAKQALSGKVFGKQVRVEWSEKDRYGRTLGQIYLGKRWINREMVESGFAWHYKQYSKDQNLANAETKARQSRIGLWSAQNPTPPWDFRRAGRSSANKIKPKTVPSNPASLPSVVYVTNTGKKYHGESCLRIPTLVGHLFRFEFGQ